MARMNYSVRLIVADRPIFTSDAGIEAIDKFERRSDEILKDAMNDARKRLRQAAPTRTRKLQRSLRVSKIRKRRHPEGEIVVGYQVTTGRKLFYAPITDQRANTRVSDWFKDALEEIQTSDPFLSWQDEVVRLFANAVRVEYRETARKSLRGRFFASFPSAKLISEGPDHAIIRAEIIAGNGSGRK